jgi:hypothetical protein
MYRASRVEEEGIPPERRGKIHGLSISGVHSSQLEVPIRRYHPSRGITFQRKHSGAGSVCPSHRRRVS